MGVLNFAARPDVVWNNFEVSADYVGYATRYTEEAYDGKVNCLFIQGGAGNQAPLYKDGGRQSPDDPCPADYALIDRMGKLLSPYIAADAAVGLRFDQISSRML